MSAGAPKIEAATPLPENYKWTALANTTAAVFMSQLDGSIVLIALPAARCCRPTPPPS